MEKFAKRLKELRTERNLSFVKLSKLTKIGASTLCMYEKCQRLANLNSLNALADFFNVSLDYLVGRED